MGGGFIQLAAYGAQDIYLTGNPQITYFRMVYKRYTNFAIENCRQYFVGNADFGKRVFCQVERIGDLMSETFLVVTLPSLVPYFKDDTKYYWMNSIGHALIESIDIEIGGKVIDKHYSVWFQIWIELTLQAGKYNAYKRMIGYSDNKCYFDYEGSFKIYVPLQFWFCRDIGLSIPLIALQNHEIKINCNFRNINELIVSNKNNYSCGKLDINTNNINMVSAFLYVDYIFLDESERKIFANREHEYLIDQLQLNETDLYSGNKRNNPLYESGIDKYGNIIIDNMQETCPSVDDLSVNCAPYISEHKVNINFNHPVIEFIWVFQNTAVLAESSNSNYNGHEIFNFGVKKCCDYDNDIISDQILDVRNHPMTDATLYIEGKERMESRDAKYYNIIQPYQRHQNVPTNFIYNYSFSLHPENPKPSGSCNYSKIDNSHFIFNLNKQMINPRLLLFARNYNIFKIKKGMASVMYAN